MYTFRQFNSLSTCSNTDCAKLATRKCSRCHVCFYCSESCQRADWTFKHKYLCTELTVYYNATRKAVVNANYDFIQKTVAWIISKPAIHELFKKRQMWLQCLVAPNPDYSLPKIDTLHMTTSTTAAIETKNLAAYRLTNCPVEWPEDAPIACKPCIVNSKDRPWFLCALGESSKLPDIITLINIAGVINMPAELVDKLGATLFGRSIGYLLQEVTIEAKSDDAKAAPADKQ
jgi:hypothetical protein